MLHELNLNKSPTSRLQALNIRGDLGWAKTARLHRPRALVGSWFSFGGRAHAGPRLLWPGWSAHLGIYQARRRRARNAPPADGRDLPRLRFAAAAGRRGLLRRRPANAVAAIAPTQPPQGMPVADYLMEVICGDDARAATPRAAATAPTVADYLMGLISGDDARPRPRAGRRLRTQPTLWRRRPARRCRGCRSSLFS